METGQKSLAQLSLEQKTPKYVTLEVASKLSGYTPDFLERLCRLRKVKYRLWNGDRHVVDLDSLLEETHSIIPSFEGIDVIDESDTKEDPALTQTTLVGSVPEEPPAPKVFVQNTSEAKPPEAGGSVSIPIAPKGSSAPLEVLQVEPERAEAMLGFSALSRKRIGESRIGEFSFVGRPVVSDPDHQESASPDNTDIRTPIPVVQGEKESEEKKPEPVKKEEKIIETKPVQTAVPPIPKKPALDLAEGSTGRAPVPLPPLPPPPTPDVVSKQAEAGVVTGELDDWDTLLLGADRSILAQSGAPLQIGAEGRPVAIVRMDDPASSVPPALDTTPKAAVPPEPEIQPPPSSVQPPPPAPEVAPSEQSLPIPPVPEKLPSTPAPLPASVHEVTDVYTTALPPRADLGTMLGGVMPPASPVPSVPDAELKETAVVNQVVAESAAIPVQTETQPLLPPLSRPQPLSVVPMEMFPKAPMVAPAPVKPSLPPFPELVPKLVGTQVNSPVHPLPMKRTDIHPAQVEGHSLLKSPAFNAAAAAVLILAALGLSFTKDSVVVSTKSQTATVGSALEGGPTEENTSEIVQSAFSDDVMVTPGTDDSSVVVTPIYESGPGGAFEYILVPR